MGLKIYYIWCLISFDILLLHMRLDVAVIPNKDLIYQDIKSTWVQAEHVYCK